MKKMNNYAEPTKVERLMFLCAIGPVHLNSSAIYLNVWAVQKVSLCNLLK